MAQNTALHDRGTALSRNWYLQNPFWQAFGPVMFDSDRFHDARVHLPDLMNLADCHSGNVLDLGCGPGRYALPLAEQGFSVVALDTSESLLEQLREKLSDASREVQSRVEVVQGDMREFSRPQAFDWVMIMWSTFGYFEEEKDHGQVLDLAYQNLRSGGCLMLDLVGLEYLCRALEPVHLTELDDGRLLIERPVLVDEMTRLENEWLLIEGESVQRAEFSHRVWSGGEMARLLAQHGFEVDGVYGDYAGQPYDLESERMLFVARRMELT